MKCWVPKGIPMMVMQNAIPKPTCMRAISIPPNTIHMMFIRMLRQPVSFGPGVTSWPNGVSASPAILKSCMPNGIPTIVMQNNRPISA